MCFIKLYLNYKKGNTKMQTGLSALSDEDLEDIMYSKPSMYAPSTERKDAWALSLYIPWCEVKILFFKYL